MHEFVGKKGRNWSWCFGKKRIVMSGKVGGGVETAGGGNGGKNPESRV